LQAFTCHPVGSFLFFYLALYVSGILSSLLMQYVF
jgi:hypothetical protein